jgi:small conductance mechanosensitive channel
MISELLSIGWVKQSILIFFIVIIAIIVAQAAKKILERVYIISSNDEENILDFDETKINFLKNTIQTSVYLLAIVIIFNSIPSLRSVGVTLFASASLITLIVGFASQQAFSNIVSGVFIIFFKPFRIGDYIKVDNNVQGKVENITARHTVLIGDDNSRIVIPNTTLSSATIINQTMIDKHAKTIIYINIPFQTDIDKAMEIMRNEAMSHQHFIDFRSHEERLTDSNSVDIVIDDLKEKTVRLKMIVWADDNEKSNRMKYDLYKNIVQHFEKEKINIG